MAKSIVKAEINEVYEKLKAFLIQNNCKIITEKPPKKIAAVQGSVWGTSPKTAQKKTTYTLWQDTEGTHITTASVLTAEYINLTIAGCIFTVVLLVVYGWIVIDLQAYASTGVQGIWSWLAQTQGHFDATKVSAFIRLTWIFAVFLAATLVLEAGIIWNVRRKIDVSAEDALRTINNK